MNSTSSTRPGLRPWQFFLTASFLGAAATVWLAPPASPAALLFMSLAVFAAGGCAIALHALLSAFSGDSARERDISTSARETLEREKLLTLRALKDLEFDKAMGKVSAADAAPMEARLRDRAMAIMQDLDGRAALRARIEAELAQRQTPDARLRAPGLEPGAGSLEPVACASCATTNDPDARFCKSCGAKLEVLGA
jgi:hypothetical protein